MIRFRKGDFIISRSTIATLVATGIFLLGSGCSTTTSLAESKIELVPVRDAKVRKSIEDSWITFPWKLTGYYPSTATMQQVFGVIEAKGIDKATVKDMFYYTRPDDGHMMLLACVERDGKPRSHCIAIDKKGNIAAYWIQTYPNSPEDWKPEYEGIEIPKAESGPGE